MRKFIVTIAVLSVLLLTAVAFTHVKASGSCAYNAQHGWHVVGGGQNESHWYDTEEECLASIVTPTNVPPTEPPTATPNPTQIATDLPVITEVPTDVPTIQPTDIPALTETPVVVVPKSDAPAKAMVCERAYDLIMTRVFRDVGYQIFDNHKWCYGWALLKHNVDIHQYRLVNP